MNLLEPDSLNPPPFSIYEDAAFAADMSMLVPDERVRDDVVDSIGWQITHTLVGTTRAIEIAALSGGDHNLLITKPQSICPSLRVVYSVQDEPPTRRIYLHRAGESAQVIGSGV